MILDSLPVSLRALAGGAAEIVFRASDAAFGPATVLLLFGVGLFLTVRFRFVQVRQFREALRSLRPRPEEGEGALSPFQAFMTALSASVGTGNIAGVATAIVSGGPGALFWLWCYGFFATAIKFTEAVLGVQYRSVGSAYLSAGPMHYLRDGLGLRRLGWLYALIAGGGGPDHDPHHPAQLHRRGVREPLRHPDPRDRRREWRSWPGW